MSKMRCDHVDTENNLCPREAVYIIIPKREGKIPAPYWSCRFDIEELISSALSFYTAESVIVEPLD